MKKSFYVSFTIFLLGLASLLTDLSSEIITPILPLFAASLGASGIIIGLLGGISDSVISIFRMYSGYLSDKLGKRKKLIISGYGLSSIAKLFLSFSTSWLQVLVFKPLERVGKGIREPPRDALAAETSKNNHGRIFGILRVMDATGAVLGSTLAFIFLWLLGLKLNTIILIAAIISFTALIPLAFVKEKPKKPEKTKLTLSLKKLPKDFKIFVMIISLFALADFSYMFFILKANEITNSIYIPILLYVLFNIVYTIFALPLGILSDKIGKRTTLIFGYILFAITLLGFSAFNSLAELALMFALYGLSYAFIVGTERAFASELIKKRYGTAFGTFHMVIGLIALPSSLIAGILWQINTSLPFLVGAIISLAAAALLIKYKRIKV